MRRQARASQSGRHPIRNAGPHVSNISRRVLGMATLEVVMVLGAMFPLAFLVFRLIAAGLRLYHAHVGNVVGSPLM